MSETDASPQSSDSPNSSTSSRAISKSFPSQTVPSWRPGRRTRSSTAAIERGSSPGFYLDSAEEAGIPLDSFTDLSPHPTTHYTRVLEQLERHEALVRERSGDDYVERMKRSPSNWVAAGRDGSLVWGIMVFRRQAGAG